MELGVDKARHFILASVRTADMVAVKAVHLYPVRKLKDVFANPNYSASARLQLMLTARSFVLRVLSLLRDRLLRGG